MNKYYLYFIQPIFGGIALFLLITLSFLNLLAKEFNDGGGYRDNQYFRSKEG